MKRKMGEKRLKIVALVSMLCLVISVLLTVTLPPKSETTGELVISFIGLSYSHHFLLSVLFLLPGVSFCSGLMVWDIFWHRVVIEKIQTGK